MKFNITIEETIVQTFSVEGVSIQDAMKNVIKQYKDSNLTVDNGELQEAKAIGYANNGQVLEEDIY